MASPEPHIKAKWGSVEDKVMRLKGRWGIGLRGSLDPSSGRLLNKPLGEAAWLEPYRCVKPPHGWLMNLDVDFPGGHVAKTPCFHCQELWFTSLVGEQDPLAMWDGKKPSKTT